MEPENGTRLENYKNFARLVGGNGNEEAAKAGEYLDQQRKIILYSKWQMANALQAG